MRHVSDVNSNNNNGNDNTVMALSLLVRTRLLMRVLVEQRQSEVVKDRQISECRRVKWCPCTLDDDDDDDDDESTCDVNKLLVVTEPRTVSGLRSSLGRTWCTYVAS